MKRITITLHTEPYTFLLYLDQFFLEREMFHEIRREIKTQFQVQQRFFPLKMVAFMIFTHSFISIQP